MKATAIALMFMLIATAAAADILEWKDAQGVSHYTNLQGEVPKEQRESVQVVVDEVARRPANEAAADSPAPAAQPGAAAAEPRLAQVVYDRTGVADAYLQGLERGLALAAGPSAGGGGVQINGPLAVANARAGHGGYGLPDYYTYPLVSTGFDRGRSRYLTLRMLLQDQFELDREGPYVFDERLVPPFGHVPLGVALDPLLPRGLPHGLPPLRVLTR